MREDALWKRARAVMQFGVPLVFVLLCTLLPVSAQGQEESNKKSVAEEAVADFLVTPVVANEKAKPRDIIKKELVVTNNTARRADIYITVRNIDPTTGDQIFEGPTESDLSTSLANWIEITRGVIELGPGESRKIPYLIHVNLTAKPGAYFARVAFHPGSNRAEAEANDTDTELILNLEVLDDAKERLQLGNFTSDESVVFGSSVSFSYLLENVGNRLIEPRGSIRIFNRRGEEVGSIPLNASGEEITPENTRQLAAAWSASGRFGKYKAFLDLEYGENQMASVQDTIYFWVFPWKEVLTALVGVLVLAVIGTYIVHMRAVARPVPAAARQKDVPGVLTPQPATPYTPPARQPVQCAPQPVQTAASPQPVRSAPVAQPVQQTVLAGRQAETQEPVYTGLRQSMTAPAQPQRQATSTRGTVTLAPRSKQAPVQSGSTVQLGPRR